QKNNIEFSGLRHELPWRPATNPRIPLTKAGTPRDTDATCASGSAVDDQRRTAPGAANSHSTGLGLTWIRVEISQTPGDDSDSLNFRSLMEMRYEPSCRDVQEHRPRLKRLACPGVT